ncbi:TIGR02680 family protein [Saccharopolyspora shandongensis]|uniref:TIGR02680 family protein n=1 Tax=Saccharopolyspora shandongensis TaxID=418495 RepID=A0A1H3P1W5_9PSEU|nr:TIGR02680 family protein [Saccharopolyspora shandongensis]SDY95041.1 TIGR02680 family protein [Saccharopolyspora shandongensis]
MSADSTESVPTANRWRLHRGGIVNIWQYAETTFDLGGGRAIFQGTNGSGKSRTLELLLPLCLDGDLRQLGSKGFDTVSIRRLMLDEYPGGPNRIGYAWIELHRETPDGGEEFLTCGIGVKASKTSQAISDSWRFITSRRVGINLYLVGADRVPLGSAQLRELLGADCVLDDQAFRAKVAASVYGVPAARYGDLLHLQRTLRNPDVGLKVLEGQLEQILSDALPPLDPGLIERLATSFDDLESIRENIVRLTGADKALTAFLSTYSGYAFGALRDRADAMRTAQDRLRALRKELTGLEKQVSGKQRDRESAQETIAELERREAELESSIDALRSHPAYSELQNLRDRERLVESARAAAVSALDTASKHRAQEHRSAESVVGMLRRLTGDSEAAGQAAARAAQQLSTAGLDGALVPRPPAIPAAEVRSEQARVRTSPEPDAEPLPVDRYAAPQLDTDALAAEFRAAVGTSEEVSAVARQRSALTLALHQQAQELDGEQDEVGELQRQARQAQLTSTEAAGRRNQAQQELTDAAAVWVERAQKWAVAWPSTVDDQLPEPPSAEDLVADRSATRQAREQARRWAKPQLHEARRQVAEVEQEIAELHAESRSREQELAELRAGHEQTPNRPAWADAERDTARGRAFYELVDFQPSLDESDRAGLEAALQSSGLLNAWVTAEGEVPGLADLLAAPAEPGSGGTLAELLSPAAEADCPVSPERVAALLASVSIDGGAGLSVSVTGAWRAGVLSGSWRKEAAEYVGAGAREAARARRIAELEEDLARLRAETGEAERRHREASEDTAALEQHLESYPDDSDLLTAHAKLTTAIESAADADQKAVQLREQHESADQRWQAAQAELVRSAGEADLPADTQALDAAHRAVLDARAGIDALREAIESRCLPTLTDLRDLSLHHDAAVADRMEAESQAEQRCAEYAEQATGLAELTSAVGGEAQQIADKVGAFERERAELRTQLPQAREKISSLRESSARLETQLEHKQSQLAGREQDATSATEAFQQAVRIPGLWSAADVGETAPDDPADAARVLAEADRRGSSEATVLNRLQTLQHSLSGNYDITAADQHGLLTVTVTGEEGPQPVADAARRVGERLGEQRGYLNERYQSIFADYLIRDLAERLRGQVGIAEDLSKRMNEVLDGARSSQGVHVQLDWQPSAALGDDIKQAIDLVRTPFASRSDDQDALLRRVFTDLIESERDSTSGGYAEILARALDYRSWFAFTVRVRDTGPDGKPRVRRLRQLSSGETRLISYVTLFAAAAAFYDAVSVSSDGRGPLRLVLLDEAFERLDDPTIARMLGLLVDLDMDWLITWPSGWGVSPKIPKMHIYDVLRPRSGHGIACTHTTWDGAALDRADG